MNLSNVEIIVSQHAEDASHLRNSRRTLVSSPHVELNRLSRTDERLAAHIDGLKTAGAYGRTVCRQLLNLPNRGAIFVNTVLAIEAQDRDEIGKLLAVAESNPDARSGLLSALGWVDTELIRGLAGNWYDGTSLEWHCAILLACGFQGVDPGKNLMQFLRSDEPRLVSCALRVAARLGRIDLLSVALTHDDSNFVVPAKGCIAISSWARLIAVMLGNRATALDMLKLDAFALQPLSDLSFKLAILAMPIEPNYAWLREWAAVANTPWIRRRLIRGCGLSGDIRFVPWLIEQMNDLAVSRLAGESFSFITGAHLALQDLERKPPENAPNGPSDDPADENVAMDEDEGLPWPDVARVHAWWSTQADRFPSGQRYLVGAPASEKQCLKVLNIGGQRQRAVAAVTRCLLKPGTPLFQVAAPAWRQKRWLAELAN
jgi:uncharacterized protein (TIGR02270 family)